MVFSYIMGNFVDMIKSYEIMNSDIDDGDNLSKFFGLMKKFNKGKDINEDVKKRLEAYFSFRWMEDKLQAIDDDDEKEMLDQLPGQV